MCVCGLTEKTVFEVAVLASTAGESPHFLAPRVGFCAPAAFSLHEVHSRRNIEFMVQTLLEVRFCGWPLFT